MTRARFNPGWKFTILVAVVSLLTVSLGIWQLNRASYKTQLYEGYLESLTARPAEPKVSETLPAFLRVRLTGRYGHEMFLVDNRVSEGEVGYWVVSVFVTDDGVRYLVNRGFVGGGEARSKVPEVDTPGERVTLEGIVWPFTGLPPLFKEDEWASEWPLRVQQLDITNMASLVSAVAAEIRLEEGQAGVSDPAPFAEVFDPDRHRGYAATWFGLTLVLVVGYVWFGRRHQGEIT